MRRWLLLPLFVLVVAGNAPRPSAAQAPAAAPVSVPAPAAEVLRTAGDRPFDIRHIRLDLKVDLPKKTVAGEATLSLRSLRRIQSVALDAVAFEIQKVALVRNHEVAPVRFSHDGKKLIVDLPAPVPPETEVVLRIAYQVRNPKDGLHFFGPSEGDPDVPLTVWSQGEPVSNRYWFPCLDQPNQRQSTELVVTVAEGFEAVSNGALVARKMNDDGTVTFHWKQEQPHPSYLVTLVVGRFDVVREEWNKLPVLYYVPKGRTEDVARTFGRTREMLDFFSRRFGVAYPWEKYAQVVAEQFGGGMENTSATTLATWTLHDERAMLDSSPDGLIAHELAHQWWGDLLTCRDWAHLWLNEGFASYAEALWEEHKNGAEAYAYNMLNKGLAAVVGGKQRPIVDRRYPNPDSMFDSRAYPKGAFVLHMLRQRLGEEAFWKGIQRYGQDHRLQAVETADLRRTLETVSGRDLEQFFYDWTERPGHPVLEVAPAYDAETKKLHLAVRQAQTGEAFHFPLKIRIGLSAGQEPALVEEEITGKEQWVTVPLSARPVLIEIDPDQAVLAEVQETKGRDLWLAQLRDGTTVTSRIRAAEYFGKSKMQADREALARALQAEKFWGVQAEIAKALAASGGEVCRDALIAGLKQEHPKVRRACAEQLAKFPGDAQVVAALKELLTRGDPSYLVEAAALESYAQLEDTGTVSVLLPWLAKPSHSDRLRLAALEGLGHARDLSAVDVLVSWTQRGKPALCRRVAVQALARLAQKANPAEGQRERIRLAVTACLKEENVQLRRVAIAALRDLGPAAAPSLPQLEALAQSEPNARLAEEAQKAVAQIRSGSTPASQEILKLREELEKLRKSQDALRERLEKYEKTERKAG